MAATGQTQENDMTIKFIVIWLRFTRDTNFMLPGAEYQIRIMSPGLRFSDRVYAVNTSKAHLIVEGLAA
jgi:hypothetical protein